MADLTKLKRRNTLGAPPSPEEASRNLGAPEIAPAHHGRSAPTAVTSAAPQAARGQGRIDARSLRRTGRTLQFSTRVSDEFDERVRNIAKRDGLMLCELLERMLDAYEQLAAVQQQGRAPEAQTPADS